MQKLTILPKVRSAALWAILLCPASAIMASSATESGNQGPKIASDTIADKNINLPELRANFINPPDEAKPWTWFHVMSGNMTREGLTKDLESLANVGVGGIILFHVTQGISHGPVKFNSPEHLDLIAHAAAECERLGIKFSFHNADGWSSSGGPWITPEQSMKRVVWSSSLSKGGPISMRLRQPTIREGFYRDIAVIAYPASSAEMADLALKPRITSSDPKFNAARATDLNADTQVKLSVDKDAIGWIQFSYNSPISVQSFLLENSPSRGLSLSLESSMDGKEWQKVKDLPTWRIGKFDWTVDDSFKAATAQHFRITSSNTIEFGEISLSTQSRVPNIVGHTSMAQVTGTQLPENLYSVNAPVINMNQMIDLTSSLDESGQLRATLPDGDWTIMRFGYTSTGATNVIASPAGTGLEVDKFSPSAFMAHYNGFIGPVIDRARAVAPNAIHGVMIDSYEVGGQNWTQGYDAIFSEKFDQSIIKWLPIYAGKLVSSAQETRDMLAKIRAFNANLMRENYYRVFADKMQEQGLESMVQPYGLGAYNDVDIGSTASIPTGEFWMGRLSSQLNDAVSAGRLYDRKIIAAEAFTSQDEINWRFTPVMGKKWGDRAWTMGINQFMFHRFAHQANTHVSPGMTMNRYGSHFDRTQIWWDKGGAAWFEYMARGHFLLRQGLPVVDVAMYVGDDSPVACQEKQNFADRLPLGVEYDCINDETLLTRSRFVDGQLLLPNGGRYRMIWWPQNRTPSAAIMARLNEAKAAGVPVALRHQGDDAAAIFTAAGLKPSIMANGAMPMFTHRKIGDTDIYFLLNFDDEDHDYDLSFNANGRSAERWDPVTGVMTPIISTQNADANTQVKLKLVGGQSAFLVFNPENNVAADISLAQAPPSFQLLGGPWSIDFDPLYSDAGQINVPQLIDLSQSDDPEVKHFSGNANYQHIFNWNDDLPTNGAAVMLELGRVEVVASVKLNGIDLGTLWTHPYAIDIAKALKKGENKLEIEVANQWVNRLIGDAALENTSGFTPDERWPVRDMISWYSANLPPPPGPRRTFSTQDFYDANDPLLPSGLIGPVRLRIEK